MKRFNRLNVLILAISITSISLASNQQLANNRTIQGKTADGAMQTTVVDENGNLKVIETKNASSTVTQNAAQSSPNQPNAPLPVTSNTNTIQQNKTP